MAKCILKSNAFYLLRTVRSGVPETRNHVNCIS